MLQIRAVNTWDTSSLSKFAKWFDTFQIFLHLLKILVSVVVWPFVVHAVSTKYCIVYCISACIHMESDPGEYWFTSQGSEDVCGLYIIGQPDQLIQIEFTHFDIDCNSGGMLAVRNELNDVIDHDVIL